jgi:dTDP-4-amino-4,6-dideoxygalactose transaminase
VTGPPVRIHLSPPDVGPDERALLLDAFDSNWIAPLGPHVDAFEQEVAAEVGAAHAVALSSGTAALHLALLLAGVGPGDRVLCSTMTFVASANAIRYVGAEPVFVDCDPATWNLSPDLLETELERAARDGERYAALVAVDLYGRCCDYERLEPICAEHGVVLIEDAAEALGATYRGRSAGTFGRFGVFSFNGNKIITTSGGGMLVTEDGEAAERTRFLATQARDPAPHYEHSVTGHNYRMSNLLAAVGRGQLRHLHDKVARRRAIKTRYQARLGDLPGVRFAPGPDHHHQPNDWLTCLTIDPAAAEVTREDVRRHLRALGIEARPIWKPMHLQPVFARHRVLGGAVSARMFDEGLCLPSGSSLTHAEHDEVCGEITAVFEGGAHRRRALRGGPTASSGEAADAGGRQR